MAGKSVVECSRHPKWCHAAYVAESIAISDCLWDCGSITIDGTAGVSCFSFQPIVFAYKLLVPLDPRARIIELAAELAMSLSLH